MLSDAKKSFDANVVDITRLLELHSAVGGDLKGRRYGLEVLNKSAIVLITAFWEAYCEDLASEALGFIVDNVSSADLLPKELKKQVAKEINSTKNELEVWKIADRGWQRYLKERLEIMKEKRNRDLNTPKASKIDELFFSTLGIETMSDSWTWKKMSSIKARQKLDKYVTLRGAVAHRGKDSETIKKDQVEDYFGFIRTLAQKTGDAVNRHVGSITKKSLAR